jgi:hypothetical protein
MGPPGPVMGFPLPLCIYLWWYFGHQHTKTEVSINQINGHSAHLGYDTASISNQLPSFESNILYLSWMFRYEPMTPEEQNPQLHCMQKSQNSNQVIIRTNYKNLQNISLLMHVQDKCKGSSNSHYCIWITSLIMAEHRPKKMSEITLWANKLRCNILL